jgi:hypothetical protein
MSRDHFHPGARAIGQVGMETPLLVPSFSSRGFPQVAGLYRNLRHDLYGVCLVSAFDVSTGQLDVELADVADLVLLDSGVYETKPIAVAADGYDPAPSASAWVRNSYRDYLRAVEPNANVLAVSFDHYGPIEQQIELAREDFTYAPSAAADFLLKPTSTEALLEARSIADRAGALSRFQVLGVTERELGDSLLDRCRTLIALRDALTETGAGIPIHVFGTITPGAVLSYFFCGADIFDGLNWLRFVYDGPELRPISEAALDDGECGQPDELRSLRHSRRNLRFLRQLQDGMRSYCASGDLGVLVSAFPVAEKAAQVAAAAGSRFPGGRAK